MVEIATRCLVDLTVGVVSNSVGSGTISGYSNLRLEIPIQIGHCTSSSSLVHPGQGEEVDEDAEDENLITALLALTNNGNNDNENIASSAAFRTIDIRHDLKQLALVMADQCGLSSPCL